MTASTPTFELSLSLNAVDVPDLREAVGWGRRDDDYPGLLARCLYWGGCRSTDGRLVAFGLMISTGFEHAYLEDVMVHPAHQRRGIGRSLVVGLMQEAQRRRIPIVTITHQAAHAAFYAACGFKPCPGGVWTLPNDETHDPVV